MTQGLVQKQSQGLALAPQLRQGLKYLMLNLPELRQELQHEMSINPVIDDVVPTLEKTTVSAHEQAMAENERVSDYPEDDNTRDAAYMEGLNRGSFGSDPEALERREKFFENQVKDETLEEHLLKQLALTDIDPKDMPLAEMLIGDLDDRGYFAGSIPDILMVSGESERKVRELLAVIRTLDPIGCGSLTPQECLLSQLEAISDPLVRLRVQALVERHWEDMAAGRISEIERDLKITRADYVTALKALRSLEPRPGRAYRHLGHGEEYIHPEVHAVKCEDGYLAKVDARSLPEIRISSRYQAMLNDPNTTQETKTYIREKIAAATAIIDAIQRRQETITSIAQAIFDAQPGFFVSGLKGLKPLTMQEIADQVGVHHTTVSRTVNGKYVTTPKGTVELRKFFTGGLVTSSGDAVTKDAVLSRLQALVDAEDKAHPLSDDRLSELLKKEGFPVARRTVAKYRGKLKLPGASERRA